MAEVTDLMRVAQWAKSSGSPSDVYNAACRMLEQADEVERLRAELAEARESRELWKDGIAAAGEVCGIRRQRAEKAEAERDALRAAVELVEKDAARQQKNVGTTKDPWMLGVYAQASRTRSILRDALGPPEKGAESNGDGRTPQTQGAVEGQEARDAQEDPRWLDNLTNASRSAYLAKHPQDRKLSDDEEDQQ